MRPIFRFQAGDNKVSDRAGCEVSPRLAFWGNSDLDADIPQGVYI